jgi:hypothetical protein
MPPGLSAGVFPFLSLFKSVGWGIGYPTHFSPTLFQHLRAKKGTFWVSPLKALDPNTTL